MPIRQRLTGTGIPPVPASNITGNVANSLTAAGTTQGTALAITEEMNIVTVCASGAGVILRADLGPGDEQEVANFQGTNALLVYPPSGGAINNGATNAGYSLAANTVARFRCIDGLHFTAVS